MIRNRQWLLIAQLVATPVLLRPVLKSHGLKILYLLVAAADRFAGSIDAENFVGTFSKDVDG